jgi:PKD repeat protein
MFSRQGDKYAAIDNDWPEGITQLILFDFDRATGKLSNAQYDKIPGHQGAIGYSVIFSPEGKYLYANNEFELYRYDLSKNDFPNRKLIDSYDGYLSWCTIDSSFCAKSTFGFWQYGSDGKNYMVSGYGTSRHMHRMDYPDEENPEFRQHAIFTPHNPWTIPNYPNFRLGPLDGSPADTLGLDNKPIAKFRYEQDTLDHLRVRFTDVSYFRPEKWIWDFGDGTTFNGKKPYWHTFPKNGTYNVCLTVSNENSSNTSCRIITIGPNSVIGDQSTDNDKEVVSIFPNPVETEMLLTISEYIPERGEVIIYDMMGREVLKQRVYYGWNDVDMSNLFSGTYIYIVNDKDRKIGHGKVVKL